MLSQLRPVLVLLALFTILTGLLYPAMMTGVAQVLFPNAANGSLLRESGDVVGSRLVGQPFADPRYLHPRPSAAGAGYDGLASSGSNLGPTSAKLAERLTADGAAMARETGASVLPADAITASGSGLDPDVSPAFAALQVGRIAQARRIAPEDVRRIVAQNTAGRTLGFLGEPRVNVLAVNLALDAASPASPPAAAPSQAPAAAAAQGAG